MTTLPELRRASLAIGIAGLKLGSLVVSRDLVILDEEDMYGRGSEGMGLLYRAEARRGIVQLALGCNTRG